jgi:large subunit ribosomal protein L35
MPKLKTVKGLKERFKVTGSGKLVGFRPGRRHLLAGKRAKIKRALRRQRLLAAVDSRKLRALLPYA